MKSPDHGSPLMVGPPRFELGSNAPEAPSIGQANLRALMRLEL